MTGKEIVVVPSSVYTTALGVEQAARAADHIPNFYPGTMLAPVAWSWPLAAPALATSSREQQLACETLSADGSDGDSTGRPPL
jgi:hypothetical protein